MISDAQLPVSGPKRRVWPLSNLSAKSALRQPSMHKILHAAPFYCREPGCGQFFCLTLPVFAW